MDVEDPFLGFVDYAISILSPPEDEEFIGPGWSWTVSRILKTCVAYSSGVTSAILLSDLSQAWNDQHRAGASSKRPECINQMKKKHKRTKLPNLVTIDSIYAKNFLSLNSVIEAVVVDAFLLPGTNIYMLTLGDFWSSNTIGLYLHRRFYNLADPNNGILKKGREIFITGCYLRPASEGSSSPRLLPSEYLVILLDEDRDEDAMLIGAQFCSDSFSSVSLDAFNSGVSYSLYARIESIGSLEIQGKHDKQRKQIILVDNDGTRLKFLLWGEQVLLANLFSVGSMLALDRPFVDSSDEICLEYGSATQLYLVLPRNRRHSLSRSANWISSGSLEIMAEDDNDLLLSIKEKMENVSLLHCICRVPEKLFKGSEENYFPKLVSVGPLHHTETTLKAMEAQKWRYLHTLLNRKPNLDESLQNCVSALKGLETRIRKCYGEEIPIGSEELVTIMLLDGCFIIELLLKYSIKGLRRRDDPIFKSKEKFLQLRSDMLLLENQIPLLVVHCLFNLVPIPEQCIQSLTELTFSFFQKTIPFPGAIRRLLVSNHTLQHLHFLDFIHNCYLPTFLEVPSLSSQKNSRCATELQEAGIKFKKATTESVLDMKFVKGGEIRIPPLKVNEYTEVTFRNLIAYENCCSVSSIKYITSYVCLMKSLVQSEKDATLLCKARILTNTTGSREEVVSLFLKLYVEVESDEFFYKALCEQVNGYKMTSWREWWPKLKHAVLWFMFHLLFLVLFFSSLRLF